MLVAVDGVGAELLLVNKTPLPGVDITPGRDVTTRPGG